MENSIQRVKLTKTDIDRLVKVIERWQGNDWICEVSQSNTNNIVFIRFSGKSFDHYYAGNT
jgi:hypothetical protein